MELNEITLTLGEKRHLSRLQRASQRAQDTAETAWGVCKDSNDPYLHELFNKAQQAADKAYVARRNYERELVMRAENPYLRRK